MENKHEIELYFFNKLRELYQTLPEGDVCSPDPPDFIIDTGIEKISVEITQIHNEKGPNEKYPPAQKHATEDLILKKAQNLFLQKVGRPLHIRFNFNDNISLSEKQLNHLAQEICNSVELGIEGKRFDEHFSFTIDHNLPGDLVHISGHYFHGITDVSWYSAKGRFVPNLTKREILNVIQKKESKIDRYRDKVDTAILVIAEGLIPNSLFDAIEVVGQNEFKSRFDKIFIIRYLSNQLVEIK